MPRPGKSGARTKAGLSRSYRGPARDAGTLELQHKKLALVNGAADPSLSASAAPPLPNSRFHPKISQASPDHGDDLDVTNLITAAATLALALFAGFQLWLQNREQQFRMRMDLFERRYTIFKAVKDLKDSAYLGDEHIENQVRAYHGAMEVFIFVYDDNELLKYIRQILATALEIKALNVELTAERLPDQLRQEKTKRYGELMQWLNDQAEILPQRIRPHLRLPV